MAGFRRWGVAKFTKNPESSFKILTAVLVITLYLLIKDFSSPSVPISKRDSTSGARIQYGGWLYGSGYEDVEKAEAVRNAMRYSFHKYREQAWGSDDVRPVTGETLNSRNGWGAFIVDSATTLVLMGLWEELALSVQHIVGIDFTTTPSLVDPFETTIRYIGGLVSLIDLSEAGIVPGDIVTPEIRAQLLRQAVTLAQALGPAYDTPTGMPWALVDFELKKGVPLHPESQPPEKATAQGLARSGSAILEYRVLTRMTGDEVYAKNATVAWAPLVWSPWSSALPGIVDGPIDWVTGRPVGRERSWDAGFDSYYEYLLKITLLAPPSDQQLPDYAQRFFQAADSLRTVLTTRTTPTEQHPMQHIFIGAQNGNTYINQMSHLACFAPGTILLGATHHNHPDLHAYAIALLEGCRHVYTSTPSKIGPGGWNWHPLLQDRPHITPRTEEQTAQLSALGFFASYPRYELRPEYVESLFYAYRITGEQRFRDWAWEVFQGIEQFCKAPYGYAGLHDVFRPRHTDFVVEQGAWQNMQESFFAAETLKYLFLTFAHPDVVTLDAWVFNTEGHPFRMIR
ncbi:glycoside hydrolase family 47 protein [Sporormia fimetaria CBS 119925]|uniref:alpha-1,2-Mannosidase n=1 Tax=Sporormia fimetaria CBS 119925 TaxID=1340428 RepID=A0A6A6V0Z4_9PLEO|nr:glycoside hydrolase family 47 protein [Sporormia fimetaria CBS 119925]